MLFSIIDNIQSKHFGGRFFGVDSKLYLIMGKKEKCLRYCTITFLCFIRRVRELTNNEPMRKMYYITSLFIYLHV